MFKIIDGREVSPPAIVEEFCEMLVGEKLGFEPKDRNTKPTPIATVTG
jgi:hypothetical protein